MVTVYVWLPEEGRVGHASMQIGAGTYVSFWPADSAGKKDVTMGRSHEAAFPASYSEDVGNEGGRANETITLSKLDEDAMVNAWKELQDRKERYNLMSYNCSTAVAAILQVGSGMPPSFTPAINIDDYVSSLAGRLLFRLIFWKATLQMWSPAAVRDYANEIKKAKQ